MITLSDMEAKVANEQLKGTDVRWDGWDIVYFYPHRRAFYSPKGVFRGTWGFEKRLTPTRNGNWVTVG